MEDQDFSKINQIDMECDFVDDDEFGGPIKTISADVTPQGVLNIQKHNFKNNAVEDDYSNYNQIDMECSAYDDTEDSFIMEPEKPKSQKPISATQTGIILDFGDDDISLDVSKLNNANILDFGDDEEYIEESFNSKELVDEEMVNEKKSKKSVTSGEVEDDYWKKMTKKHAKTDVKGARGAFVHMSGNPALEKDMFNHDMGSDAIMKVGSLNADGTPALSSVGGGFAGGSSGASASVGGDCSVGISSGFAGGESLEDRTEYDNLCEDLLMITGFNVSKNDDGTYTLSDILSNKNYNCNNNEEVFANLKPYVDDCFIYPLQITTGEKFNTCKEWCDWYNDDMKNKYPECANDIKYCDLIANHCNDCKF